MLRTMLRRLTALAPLLVIGCRGPTPAPSPSFDLAATRRIIAQQNAQFARAHVAGDIATIDAMFAPDATAYPPGVVAVKGSLALHNFSVAYLEADISDFREETTDFYGNAEYVVDAGTYSVTYGPAHTTERGKYLNVWRQVNGSWKLMSNMWNTDAAPQ